MNQSAATAAFIADYGSLIFDPTLGLAEPGDFSQPAREYATRLAAGDALEAEEPQVIAAVEARLPDVLRAIEHDFGPIQNLTLLDCENIAEMVVQHYVTVFMMAADEEDDA